MALARPTMMDRMIASVAPVYGARRIAARSAFQTMAAAGGAPTEPGGKVAGQGGYRGGQSGRRQTRGWFARARSADQDNARQKTLIARSRDAAMNLPLATAAIERNVTFTVGTGLMAFPDLDHEALGITAEAAAALTLRIARDYDAYLSSTDPDAERTSTGYGQQAVLLRGVLEGGDMLAVRCMPTKQIGRVHETAWKLIEADRIVSPTSHQEGTKLSVGGNVCTLGVEVDDFGAPQRFHVLKKAPDSQHARAANDTVSIEAWGKESRLPTALLLMDKRRAEQSRGVPFLAPVLEVLRQVSDATDAELIATVMQGMLAIIYKTPGATAMPEPVYERDAADGESMFTGGDGVVGVEGERPPSHYNFDAGTVLELDSDAEVDMKTPGRPNPAYDKFFEAVGTQIGAALETPFEVLMARFESSYTASRAALELFYKRLIVRLNWLASMWCTPAYQCWLYEQVANGVYDMPGFFDDLRIRALWSSVRHRGDGKISLDPAREAKALETHEAHGWKTGQEITAELTGGDFDANIQRRGREHKQFVDAGLPIPNARGGGTDTSASADGGDKANAA